MVKNAKFFYLKFGTSKASHYNSKNLNSSRKNFLFGVIIDKKGSLETKKKFLRNCQNCLNFPFSHQKAEKKWEILARKTKTKKAI